MQSDVPVFLFWLFFLIFMKISAMVFQSLDPADAIKWKIIGLIESSWPRHKQALFYLVSGLWDILKRMKHSRTLWSFPPYLLPAFCLWKNFSQRISVIKREHTKTRKTVKGSQIIMFIKYSQGPLVPLKGHRWYSEPYSVNCLTQTLTRWRS